MPSPGNGSRAPSLSGYSGLLNRGKKINYQGAAVTAGFDRYHNTFGDWLVTQVGADGTTQNGILKVPATAVASYKS